MIHFNLTISVRQASRCDLAGSSGSRSLTGCSQGVSWGWHHLVTWPGQLLMGCWPGDLSLPLVWAGGQPAFFATGASQHGSWLQRQREKGVTFLYSLAARLTVFPYSAHWRKPLGTAHTLGDKIIQRCDFQEVALTGGHFSRLPTTAEFLFPCFGLILIKRICTYCPLSQRRQCNLPQYSCLENPMDRGAWWAAVHGVAQSRTWLSYFTFTFHFHALEKEMATHSGVLAWGILGMGEPGGLLSMGSHRAGHDWSDLAAAAAAAALCQSCFNFSY